MVSDKFFFHLEKLKEENIFFVIDICLRLLNHIKF